MSDNRRDFLRKSTLLGLTGLVGSLAGKEQLDAIEKATEVLAGEGDNFKLPPLPYAYDALEPYIDKQTMETHHTKHHKAYIDKLNSAPPGSVDLKLDDTKKCGMVNKDTPALVRNNLGGFYNHSLFWQMMKPNPTGKPNQPGGKLSEAINKNFQSFDAFKSSFSEQATKIFGSGWCWLMLDSLGNLKITTTPNQDNILMNLGGEQGKPVLALDVWEHAYYLKYQNKRADYIGNWWNVVNWDKAEELYTAK
jgi:Fe-Mn family superoxide dismutase